MISSHCPKTVTTTLLGPCGHEPMRIPSLTLFHAQLVHLSGCKVSVCPTTSRGFLFHDCSHVPPTQSTLCACCPPRSPPSVSCCLRQMPLVLVLGESTNGWSPTTVTASAGSPGPRPPAGLHCSLQTLLSSPLLSSSSSSPPDFSQLLNNELIFFFLRIISHKSKISVLNGNGKHRAHRPI